MPAAQQHVQFAFSVSSVFTVRLYTLPMPFSYVHKLHVKVNVKNRSAVKKMTKMKVVNKKS